MTRNTILPGNSTLYDPEVGTRAHDDLMTWWMNDDSIKQLSRFYMDGTEDFPNDCIDVDTRIEVMLKSGNYTVGFLDLHAVAKCIYQYELDMFVKDYNNMDNMMKINYWSFDIMRGPISDYIRFTWSSRKYLKSLFTSDLGIDIYKNILVSRYTSDFLSDSGSNEVDIKQRNIISDKATEDCKDIQRAYKDKVFVDAMKVRRDRSNDELMKMYVKLSSDKSEWRPCYQSVSLFIEFKTGDPSLGELMRQVNRYKECTDCMAFPNRNIKEHRGRSFIVIFSHEYKYKQQLLSQGIDVAEKIVDGTFILYKCDGSTYVIQRW